MKKHLSGFTLIELLIVVAIIAILAAIAVPNFLEAQTRAKVTRAAADLRSLTTAIEMYRIDQGKAPWDYNVPAGDFQKDGMQSYTSGICHPGAKVGNSVKPGLTTPVSYITNCWLQDPFTSKYDTPQQFDFDQFVYTYNPLVQLWGKPTGTRKVNSNYINHHYADYYGEYRLGSIGPDRDWYNGAGFSTYRHSVNYDASNGTLSIGNIWRSQKNPQVTGRPPMDV